MAEIQWDDQPAGGGPQVQWDDAQPDRRSSGRKRFDAVIKPITGVVGRGLEAVGDIGVPFARMAQGESVRESFNPRGILDTQGAGGAAETARNQAAQVLVPQTPLQAGIAAGTVAAGPLTRAVPALAPLANYPAIARILGGTLGGAAGGAIEDPTLASTAKGAAWGAGTTTAGEAIGKTAEWLSRIGPGAKTAVNEEAARRLADVAQTVNPSAAPAIAGAKQGLNPRLRGARMPAAMQESTLGGSLQSAASGRMDQAMQAISAQAPNLRLTGPALQSAFNAMPALAKEQLVGQVGPGGLTLQQAQAVRGWLGSGAFSQSPVGQGVGAVPQQKLWGQVSQEIESALGPLAGAWHKANQEYGGLMVLQDALSQRNAFTGGPNRIGINMPAIQQWLSTNRQSAADRMGHPAFEAMTNAVTGGGQLGTRDVLTPGFGGPLDALRQVYGRGQGGAPQIAGSLLRTAAPNIGSQYTGRTPMQLPPALQQALDLVLQRQMGASATP